MAIGPKSERYDMKGIDLQVRGIYDGSGNALTGAALTPESNVADVTATTTDDIAITWTTGNPSITPDGAITIADGADPTVVELQHFCVELNAKVETLVADVAALTSAVNDVLAILVAQNLMED